MRARVTIVDIARLAGVNASTVSRALADSPAVSPQTKARILDIVKDTGYVASHGARMFKSRRAGQILVIVPNIAASFYPEVILGVEEALDAEAFGVIIGSTRGSEEREASLGRQLLTGAADGLILLGGRLSRELIALSNYKRRIIAISRPVPNAGIACVTIDNQAAARDATQHFLSLGLVDIVHLAGPAQSPVFAARAAGYREAMAQAGLSPTALAIHLAGFNVAAGRQAMRDLLTQGRMPRAVLCASDEMAFGAMQVARQAGFRVPEDMAFIGFDDHSMSEAYEPALTTIRIPRRDMGFTGAKMLLRGLEEDDDAPQKDRILPHELIVRQSCGASLRKHDHRSPDDIGRPEI